MRKAVMLGMMLACSMGAIAQIELKSEYFNAVKYNKKHSDEEGKFNAVKEKLTANVMLSRKISDGGKKINIWGGFITGSYFNVNETTNTSEYPIDEILTANVGVNNYRTLSDRWNLLSAAGVGIATSDVRLKALRWNNFMVFAMSQAIYKVNDNLELGTGAILSNAYELPIVLPSFYINWHTDGDYSFKLTSRTYDIDARLTRKYSDAFNLSFTCNYDNIGAPVLNDTGSDTYVGFSYLAFALRPEFVITDKLSIPVSVGFQSQGVTTNKDRKPSEMLKSGDKWTHSTGFYQNIAIRYAL